MAKSSRSKSAPSRSTRRRVDLRRTLPRRGVDLRGVIYRADLLKAFGIVLLFLLAASVLVNISREQILASDGQIMTDTRIKRLNYTVEDHAATEDRREAARRESPRVYRLNQSHLAELQTALNGLPKAIDGHDSLEEIREELIHEFALTEDALDRLQQYVEDGEPSSQWRRWTERLVWEQLRQRPLIDRQEYQIYITTRNHALLMPDGELVQPIPSPIELRRDITDDVRDRVRNSVDAAGFPEEIAAHVRARLLHSPQTTLVFDEPTTRRIAEEAAAAVEPVMEEHERGEVLYKRGDVLSSSQYVELETEREKFLAHAGAMERWMPRLSIVGLIALLTLFLASHIILAYPRITRNAMRIFGIAALMIGMLALSALISRHTPNLLPAAAVAPTMFVAMVVLLAYDQRLSLFLSGMQCLLVVLALNQGIGWFILLMAGCGMMILQLRDLRHRNTLIRAATTTAIVLAVGMLLLGAFEVPLVPETTLALTQIGWNALWAAVGSFAVGFLMLGILPGIERAFDITTGMTLAELRDPKQPLLRQLQQRAPGTYNHSLQVANIAEAAADAIGANGLEVYVGALYHDVGKLNKPDYFVENQTGGPSKHEKLSPAMSLLVIVGHVKDGIELAREYALPRSIIHFIESHHGTTLVEFFYHAAKSQASHEEKSSVAEVEFRYPGPKPRTKEAAILMLSDAVESATRAMADPNPSRIETLVRELSHKRLMDGQFDQCDLTFRELGLMEETMISRLCAIHHSRISYPGASRKQESAQQQSPQQSKQVSA